MALRDGMLVWCVEPGEGRGTPLAVRAVGGGQEAGEHAFETAAREAAEETGATLRFLRPSRTLWWREDPRTAQTVLDRASPTALVVGATPRPSPEPYKPGLPAGDTLYLAVYLAEAAGALRPGEDQVGLLIASWELTSALAEGREWTVSGVEAAGGGFVWRSRATPSPKAAIAVPSWEVVPGFAAMARSRGCVWMDPPGG